MNLRRSIFAVVIGLVILVFILIFNLVLYIPSGEGMPSPVSLTRDYIETQNHVIETLFAQTQTATVQAPTGTFTPAPAS